MKREIGRACQVYLELRRNDNVARYLCLIDSIVRLTELDYLGIAGMLYTGHHVILCDIA
jgi:hypothetical protein